MLAPFLCPPYWVDALHQTQNTALPHNAGACAVCARRTLHTALWASLEPDPSRMRTRRDAAKRTRQCPRSFHGTRRHVSLATRVRTQAVFVFVRTWISLSRGNKPVMPITRNDQLGGGCEQDPAAREPREKMTYRVVETQHVPRHAALHRTAPRRATPRPNSNTRDNRNLLGGDSKSETGTKRQENSSRDPARPSHNKVVSDRRASKCTEHIDGAVDTTAREQSR